MLVNSQTELLFGYGRDELIGQPVETLVPERFRAGHRDHRGGYFADPRTRPMGAGLELFGRRRDGREFPVEISLLCIETARGVVATAAIRDMTDRRAAEQLHRQLASIVASSEDAIIGQDLDGTITSWNPGAERLYGYPSEEAIGRSVWMLALPEHEGAGRQLRARVLGGERVASVETRHLRRDGTQVSVSLTISPIRDARRAIVGLSLCSRDNTRLRAAERAASDSQVLLQALLDHAPMAMSLRDTDGRFVFANRRAAELMGVAVEDLVGRAPSELCDASVGRQIDESERPVREGQGAVTFELTGPHPDGSDHDYVVTKYPVTDRRGNVFAVGGISLDITERKRAEAAVARMAVIIESTDEAMFASDREGHVLSWNPAAERVYGYSAEEAIGRSVSFMVPLERAHEVPELLTRLQRGESVVQFETVRRRKDGTAFDVSLTLSPVTDATGAVAGVATIARDITHQRAMQDELRAAEERFRTTIDRAPIGIALFSSEGRWLRVNRALCEMTGYREDELLGKRFREITHPDDLGIDVENVEQLLAGEAEAYEVEKRYLHASGSVLWVLLSVSLVRDEAGTPMHFVCQVQDITHQKDSQARLAMHAREQEALTAVATLVASEATPRAVFAAAAEHVATVLHADFGGVARLEASGQARLLGSWSRQGLPVAPTGALLDLEAPTAVAAALRTGRSAEIERYNVPVSGPIPVRSGLAAPIEVNGHLWGAVSVGWQNESVSDPHAAERIARFAELVRLAIAGAEAREQLARLASTDPLTGLYNQRSFSDRLEEQVGRARRHGRPLSLVVFDLDHFKLVNDTHGHDIGNRVLSEFAGRLMNERRDGDIVARVGGEEFAWILPATEGQGALTAAQRALHAIADKPFDGGGRLTTSAGVCALSEATDARELFRHADLALYWAKSNGRNAVVRYGPDTIALLSPGEHADRLEQAKTLAAVRALATAVDAKDPSTQRHSERVADLAAQLAAIAGWDHNRIAQLRDAALVHDVGKIGIPDQILLKPGKLTASEYEQVKAHAALGAQMLLDLLNPEQVDWIRHHHERYDGNGYPDRIAGTGIAEGARLLAVADAWDAMTVARPYGTPRSPAEALRECREVAGTHLCPAAVAALVTLHDRAPSHSPHGSVTPDPGMRNGDHAAAASRSLTGVDPRNPRTQGSDGSASAA